MRAMEKRRVQWSNLPTDLLSAIAQRLTTRTDLRHFRAVCTSWRSSTCLPPPKSSLIIPGGGFITSSPNTQISLAESTIYCIQSLNTCSTTNTQSWFIQLQQNPTQPHKMILLDPFSKHQIHKLPKAMPKTINLLDYKLTEISNVFSLRCSNPDDCDPPIEKAVTSSIVVDANFIVFVLLFSGQMGVWQMGNHTWTEIDFCAGDHRDESPFCDVVFYKGKFYVVSYSGRVLLIDSEFKITETASVVVDRVGFRNYKHFVVSFGELFLLERCFNEGRESDNGYHSVYWKVYKLNEENNDWVLVNSLGDRVFFVSFDSSFSVSARDFPGCKGNTIYFVYNFYVERNGDYPGCNAGIYDLEDGSVGPLSAFPGYSNVFWPPPTWLKPNPLPSSA